VDALVWALSAAAFLTAALSGIAGLGGGTILIGVLYAVGMAPVEAVLIAAYSRPFTGEISVKPDLLKQALLAGPRRESLPLGMSVMGH
jgi:hypothetical protein